MDARVVFLLLTAVVSSTKSQCTVSVPTITKSTDDVCLVVSQGSLSYSCTENGFTVIWASTVWSSDFSATAGGSEAVPPLTVSGVTATENDNNNSTCLTSTLTFTGGLSSLTALNGATLSCDTPVEPADSINIVVPIVPDSPTSLMVVLPSSCDSAGNQVTIQWTPPTNTGGQGVVITHYVVDVTGPAGYSCTPDQCNVTGTTNTTITGLQCGNNYSVTVRAVNCRGVGTPSQPAMINFNPPGIPSFDTACIDNDSLTLQWTAPVGQSDCGSSLTYDLTVTNATNPSPIVTSDTSATVPVDISSDDYTVSIAASNGCPGLAADEIVISTACVVPSSTPPVTDATTSSTTLPINTMLPQSDGIGPIAGGAGGGAAAIIAAVVIPLAIICVCVFCPCPCCMPCRRICCCCCSEEKICCGGDDGEYSAPTPHVEKQPVLQSYSKEANEKDVETGQPSYPPGPLYQDPSTIQRQAAPTGDLYAQPERPAKNRPQQPAAVEMATYQDPSTIQRQAAPTGDLYAQPDKPHKTPAPPAGQAPLYSLVDKQNTGGMVYADLSHSEAPAGARRPPPTPETFYAEVRDSRP